jgi:hypothetical protein
MDNSFKDESIAYALAMGMVPFGSLNDLDRDVDRQARRARWERRKQKQRDQ